MKFSLEYSLYYDLDVQPQSKQLEQRRRVSSRNGFYEEDLAYIHHVGYRDFGDKAAPALLDALRKAGLQDGLVIDLGCGGGSWLSTLGKAGYDTVGVDISPHFVALARETAPNAKLVTSSAYDFDIPNCMAVTAIGEVLCYVPPSATETPPLENLCMRAFESLTPSGLFIFDLVVSGRSESPTAHHCSNGEDWAILVEKKEDANQARLTRDITLFRQVDGHYRRSQETHSQHLFADDDVESMLKHAGFCVETSKTYGDFSLPPGRLAFKARKP